MTTKHKKLFGVWMDSMHATIVGGSRPDTDEMVVVGHVSSPGPSRNSSEKAAHHEEIALAHAFFKAIAAYMPLVDELHVTGTGQVQEQFIRYLADTPHYKRTLTTESTSNKMSDQQLIRFIAGRFH